MNKFDRTTMINHDVQMIIEKDDDDNGYSLMNINETSNRDLVTSSSRGPVSKMTHNHYQQKN